MIIKAVFFGMIMQKAVLGLHETRIGHLFNLSEFTVSATEAQSLKWKF